MSVFGIPLMIDCALLLSSPRKLVGGGDAGVGVMEVPGSVELPGLMLPIAESPEEAHLRHRNKVYSARLLLSGA